MKMIETVKDAALALDKIEPGWANKVSTWRLCMTSMRWCVLGQIGGAKLPWYHFWGETFTPQYGKLLDANYFPEDVGVFTSNRKSWIREIKARR